MTRFLPFIIYGSLAIGLLFGGYLSCLGVRNVWRGWASTRWPKTTGVVTTSQTDSSTTVDKKTGRIGVDYSANLVFRYNINGRDYTTPLIAFGQTYGSGDPTEALLRHLRYPEGAEVSISYNPADPSIAAVQPGFHAASLWLVIAGLMFSLPCIMAGVICATSENDASNNLGMAIGAGIFASIFAMAGIAALTFGLINLSLGRASVNWPKTPGVITYQEVEGSEVDTTPPDQDNPGQQHTIEKTYTDYLVFTYEVDGKKHFSNLRQFGLLGGGAQDAAEAVKARYPSGKAVTVFYSPDNPDLSVIESGISSDAYWMPGIGVGILLFVLAVCVFIIPSLLH